MDDPIRYPAMLYKGGALSGNPDNQRTVDDEEQEMLAMADGYVRMTHKEGEAPPEAKPTKSKK